MLTPDHLFLIFLATILITRLWLFCRPTASPTVRGFRLHHYMYGIVLIVAGLFAKLPTLSAVGLGLFIDELPFLLLRGKNHADNYSWKSIVGVTVLVVAVYLFRYTIFGLVG